MGFLAFGFGIIVSATPPSHLLSQPSLQTRHIWNRIQIISSLYIQLPFFMAEILKFFILNLAFFEETFYLYYNIMHKYLIHSMLCVVLILFHWNFEWMS